MTIYVCTDPQFRLTGNSFNEVEETMRNSPIGISCTTPNKCYANSVLQFIFSSINLTKILIIAKEVSVSDPKKREESIIDRLFEIYDIYHKSQDQFIKPTFQRISQKLSEIEKNQFDNNLEQDANEFLIALLGQLREFFDSGIKPLPANSSVYRRNVCGLLEVSYLCENCIREEKNLDIEYRECIYNLKFPSDFQEREGIRLTDMLKDHVNSESDVDKQCKHKCNVFDGVNIDTKHKKSDKITMRDVVIVNLGRFELDNSGIIRKIDKNVQVDLSMTNDEGEPLNLVSFIHHDGTTPQSGHYVCFCRYNGRWYECNDSVVVECELTFIEKIAMKSYMFLYEKNDP